MKKSLRFIVSGSLQPMFFNKFIKENAEKLNIKGFVRNLEEGKIEIFIEGNIDSMEKMAPLCRRGPQHSVIRNIDEKEERFQDFKDFKILKF